MKSERSQLNNGWEMVKFGDIAENIATRVKPSESESDIYVGLEHLDPETLHLKKWGQPSDVEGDKLRFWKGDIIFGRRRAYQRKLAIAEFDGICSAHAIVLRAKPKIIRPNFLPFFLKSDMFMERAIGISVGSLSPTINWKTLREEEFPLPPLDEQKHIAEILWAADETVERYEDAKVNTIKSMNAVFRNLVQNGKPRKMKIRELGAVITGSTPSTKNSAFYSSNDFMFISPADIDGDKYVCKTKKMVSSEGYSVGRSVPKGTIMVVCIGSTTGKVAITSEECITNQQINSLICDEHADPEFIYHLFKGMEKLFWSKASCTAVPILNKTQFSNIYVDIPDIEMQRAIVNTVRYFERAEIAMSGYLDEIRALVKNLLKKYVDNF